MASAARKIWSVLLSLWGFVLPATKVSATGPAPPGTTPTPTAPLPATRAPSPLPLGKRGVLPEQAAIEIRILLDAKSNGGQVTVVRRLPPSGMLGGLRPDSLEFRADRPWKTMPDGSLEQTNTAGSRIVLSKGGTISVFDGHGKLIGTATQRDAAQVYDALAKSLALLQQAR